MNYQLLTGPELSERLELEIDKNVNAKLAVAFWGKGAAQRLKTQEGAQIVCNLASGGTNPSEIRTLLDRGAEVKQHNTLHAKIGYVGDGFSFVGSSNMSANGLGDEGGAVAGWEESNVVFDGAEPSVKARFKELWDAAEAISNASLTNAEKLWRARQKANQAVQPRPDAESDLIEALKNAPEHFEAHNTHVVIYEDVSEEDSKLDEASKMAKDKFASSFEVYWDWQELPKDALILEFRKPVRGQIAFSGIFKRSPDFPDFLHRGDSFQVAFSLDDLAGYAIGEQEQQIFRKAASRYVQNNDGDEDGAYVFPISGLVQYLGEA